MGKRAIAIAPFPAAAAVASAVYDPLAAAPVA